MLQAIGPNHIPQPTSYPHSNNLFIGESNNTCMADMTDHLDKGELKKFSKELTQLFRVIQGIQLMAARSQLETQAYILQAEDVAKQLNRKYPSLSFIGKAERQPIMEFYIRKQQVKEVFRQAAAIDGLIAIGTKSFGAAKIEDTDKFSKEIDKIAKEAYLTFEKGKKASFVILRQQSPSLVQVDFDLEQGFEPALKLLAHYALEGKHTSADILSSLHAFGFAENPDYYRQREWLNEYSPRVLDI